MNHNDSHDAIKRTLEWVRYNVKGYLNLRWRLVTIDLRSKLCMCSVLDTVLTKNFAADLSLQTFNTRSLGKVWLEILVTNLTTYFHNLVAKVKNLVPLAPILGAILCPVNALSRWLLSLLSALDHEKKSIQKWRSLQRRILIKLRMTKYYQKGSNFLEMVLDVLEAFKVANVPNSFRWKPWKL